MPGLSPTVKPQPTTTEGLPDRSRPPDFNLTPKPPPLRDLFDRLQPAVKGKGQGKPKGRSREGPYEARPWHYDHMPPPPLPPRSSSSSNSRNWAVIYSEHLATGAEEFTTFGWFTIGIIWFSWCAMAARRSMGWKLLAQPHGTSSVDGDWLAWWYRTIWVQVFFDWTATIIGEPYRLWVLRCSSSSDPEWDDLSPRCLTQKYCILNRIALDGEWTFNQCSSQTGSSMCTVTTCRVSR